MEAAVLKPRMMADARVEREVQKLQELVRKLERQNEQLRTRANIVPPSPACLRATSRCIPSPAPSLACQYFPPDDPFPYFQPHSAADDEDDEEDEEDELMLLELERVSPSGESEETWLYESPRSHLWSGAVLDALQWTRHILDQLRPELDAGRHSLGQRLESGRSVRRGVDGDVSEPDRDSVTLGHRLQDLTDVQVMARLQEESLRQDYASSSSSSVNRRSGSFSFQFGQRGDLHLNEEEEDEDEDYGQLPPPQPRLSRAGPLPHSQTFSSLRDWTRSSTPRSSAAPQTQTQTGLRSSSDKLRRSMPNLLVSAALSPVSSSPALRSSQSFESSGALTVTRLQSSIPAPAPLQNRVQSLGSFSSRQPLKATAYVSPTIKSSSVSLQSLSVSEIPKASVSQVLSRSGLPRPASFIASSSSSRSRLTAPVRSLLTPPRSWREGCF
ncbi:SLAIN motif-containing protein 1-like isoform X2 [Carassius carassius]|uniref:SLAIN motif-containing protein 1-like isoform X2 n=1 Tax=Carassius carassius TaxID=217509 RepID=UPI00286926FB|nr:SLAIN motif-containing protein 1-like isoform X2 [Carassius carassius]